MKNRNAFVLANLLAMTCLGTAGLDAHAEGRARSSFRYPEIAPGKRVDSHQGLLEYVISNVGDEPIYIQNELHPITSQGSTRLMGDSLSVVASDGTEARYQGSFVSLVHKGPLPSTAIQPGETRVYLVDIQKSYIIKPGVRYKVGLKSSGIISLKSTGGHWDIRTYESEDTSILIDQQHYIRPKTKEEIIEHQRSLKAQRLREAHGSVQPTLATCSTQEAPINVLSARTEKLHLVLHG